MPDYISIRIRDQIATQIADAAYTVHVSRTYPVQDGGLPAVCVALGDDALAAESFDNVDVHQHTFALRCYVEATGDVDLACMAIVQTVREALKSDTSLNGLVDDSVVTDVAAPQHEAGKTKHAMCEITLQAVFTD